MDNIDQQRLAALECQSRVEIENLYKQIAAFWEVHDQKREILAELEQTYVQIGATKGNLLTTKRLLQTAATQFTDVEISPVKYNNATF